MARTNAVVDGATLVLPGHDARPITVDTPAWFAWLEHAMTFAFTSPSAHFTARKERQPAVGIGKPIARRMAPCFRYILVRCRISLSTGSTTLQQG
jgi:hypothetical protein